MTTRTGAMGPDFGEQHGRLAARLRERAGTPEHHPRPKGSEWIVPVEVHVTIEGAS
ncbi:hypothetical protein [Streptomyces violarus]|uniref:Uncharacterized protein n=1 Tax=Streptomyces violarus TaxID=67380 RepID=A0A7W4ZJM1_9ACTN|nr:MULTISPECIES: hypothetical protein [Streptomyces]MBB3073672.1 hypothetical protein [Streptomyces violarus]WRT96433.1 hypothetical protein VJ737_01480 [Streptomyces sp. CGMCC 4.1772]